MGLGPLLKMAICEEVGLLPDNESADNFIFSSPDSRTVRNQFLLFIRHAACSIFIITEPKHRRKPPYSPR